VFFILIYFFQLYSKNTFILHVLEQTKDVSQCFRFLRQEQEHLTNMKLKRKSKDFNKEIKYKGKFPIDDVCVGWLFYFIFPFSNLFILLTKFLFQPNRKYNFNQLFKQNNSSAIRYLIPMDNNNKQSREFY